MPKERSEFLILAFQIDAQFRWFYRNKKILRNQQKRALEPT